MTQTTQCRFCRETYQVGDQRRPLHAKSRPAALAEISNRDVDATSPSTHYSQRLVGSEGTTNSMLVTSSSATVIEVDRCQSVVAPDSL